MRGKLYLLAIDKILISGMIAVVFVVYSCAQTVDTRRYDEARREVDLTFKRAEYVKEFVPIAIDSAADVMVRAQALTALIETESISAQSAVYFAQRLLLADLLGRGRTPTYVNPDSDEVHEYSFSSNAVYDILLAPMIRLMPMGLHFVIEEYTETIKQRRALTRETPGHYEQNRILNATSGFWIRLFRESVMRFKDSDLVLIDSKDYLAQNLANVEAIVSTLSRSDAEEWFKRENRALKMIGALHLMQSRDTPRSVVVFLRSEMNPDHGMTNVDYASEVIRLIHRHVVVHPDLSAEALAVVLRRDNLSLHREDPGDERSPVEDHFYAASEYLVWSGRYRQVASALERSVIADLRLFYDHVKSASVESLDYDNYPIEWTLVDFLLTSKAAREEQPSRTRRFLSQLFAIGDAKLSRTGLEHYARTWRDYWPND